MILAGDIGGTNARLVLFEMRTGRAILVALKTYASRGYRDLKQNEGDEGPSRHAELPRVAARTLRLLASCMDLFTPGRLSSSRRAPGAPPRGRRGASSTVRLEQAFALGE